MSSRKGGLMYESFYKLSLEKQEAIINAAYDEFGSKSYSMASTNDIAKKAGISKGLIFHYFGNKEGLYIFLMDRAIASIREVTNPILEAPKNDDIISTIMAISTAKIKRVVERPRAGNFLLTLYLRDTPKEILERYRDVMDLQNNYDRLFDAGIAEKLLKPGIDIEIATKLFKWTLLGFSGELVQHIKDLNVDEEKYYMLNEELRRYLTILKDSLFLKEE
jgi:AcrR family transcriptional regulator